MEKLLADIRHAFRVALKNPRFSLVAIAALALGVGANAAIFSVVNAVLLRPLPYPEPDRLVELCRVFGNDPSCSVSMPKLTVWQTARSFTAIGAYDFAGPGFNLGGGERPEPVPGIHASAGYFQVLGAGMTVGRAYTAEEDRPGGPRVAVISHALWARRFGSDPSALGRALIINGDPYTIIGVLAAGFRPQQEADVFLPVQGDPNSTDQGNYLNLIARLKPGVTIAQAKAEMQVVGERFRKRYPEWMSEEEHVGVFPLRDMVVRDVRPALLILLGAVGLVLLIACANVANLLLARATGRQREIAIRAAIGAGRGAIVRQLLTESVMLASIGAVTGVLLGAWGARALIALRPGSLPRADDLANGSLFAALLDWRMLAFTVGAALVTGVVFGLAPALHLARADLAGTLKDAGGRGSTGHSAPRTRGVLVVAEVALATVLLVGATLLIRTSIGLGKVQPGLDPNNLLTFQTSLAGDQYSTTAQMTTLTRRITQQLDAVPGVVVSAQILTLPTTGDPDLPFSIVGRPLASDQHYHGDENYVAATPHAFQALGVPLLRGRMFTDADVQGSTPVVIVNEAFAKKFWPDSDAVGHQLLIGQGLGPEFEEPARLIVGVVGNVRDNGLDHPAPPVIYTPSAQMSDGLTKLANTLVPLAWVVRTAGDPVALEAQVRREVLAVDPLLPITKVRPMEQVLAESIARQNFNTLVLSIFGGVALLLAAIGIYGLMSYSVEQAKHDIGVRLALGAGQRDIVSLVLGRGMRLTGIGVAVGALAAYGAVRVLQRMLFGVHPGDPATYAVVVAAVGLVALVACYVPALRAGAVDPIVAMREE